MKKLFILFVLINLFSIVFALQTQWNTNGEQIFEMENINYSSIVADDNYYYVSYDAAFDGDRDIYMQKYDENFTPLWGEHGIKLCYAPHSQETSKIFLINDFLYVVWHDFRANNGKFSLYIQKMTKEGEILWASSGIQISNEFNSFCDYNVLSDDNDGVFITWNFDSYPFVNHLNSNGVWTQGWNAHGNQLFGIGGSELIKTSDSNIAYFYYYNNCIYMNKITVNGLNYWEEPKLIFENANTSLLHVVKNDYNEIYLLNKADYLNIKKIDEEGNIIWQNSFDTSLPPLNNYITTQNGDLIFRSGNSLYRVSRNGELLWENENIFPSNIQSVMKSDNNNGCIMVIPYYHTAHNSNELYFQHFAQNGEALISEEDSLIRESHFFPIIFSIIIKSNRYDVFWIENTNYDTNFYVQTFNYSNLPIYQDPFTIKNSSLINTSLYKILFDYQNKPTFLWINYFNSYYSPHIFIGKIDNLSQNSFPKDINSIEFSDDLIFNTSFFSFATDKYQDIIGVAAIGNTAQQTGDRQMIFKAFQENGNFLYQYSVSQPENVSFDRVKIINASQDEHNSIFLIFFESLNFSTNSIDLHYIKLVNGVPEFEEVLPVQEDIYLNENAQIKLFDHYLLIKYENFGNAYKLFRIDSDYNIDTSWQTGDITFTNISNLEISQLSNGNLAIIYPENNALLNMIITPDGEVTQTELFQSDYLYDFLTLFENDYADIILKENNLLKRYRYSYSGDYISSSLIMENYDKEPIKLFKSEDNYQLFSLYNQPNSNISKIYLEEFNSNFELVSENIVVDTYDSWLQPTILKQNSNDFFIFWIDGRLNNQYDPEGCKRCKHLNYFYTYSNTFFGQYITSTLDSNDDAINSPENRIAYNFPNPFNPTTTIVYNPTKENLKNAVLEIYNIKGQKINEFNVSGKNSSLVWNGKDKKGNELPSGVYLYKLKAEGHSKTYTKKMILLK